RKVDTGFRTTSCSSKKLERDGDSKKSHHALRADGSCPSFCVADRGLANLSVMQEPRSTASWELKQMFGWASRRDEVPGAWPTPQSCKRRRSSRPIGTASSS